MQKRRGCGIISENNLGCHMRTIIELSRDRLEEAVDFSWQVYTEPENSCNPVFEDKDDLREAFSRTFARPDNRLLALENSNGELIGILNLSVKKDELYIQANGIFMREPCDDFISYIQEHYQGYEMDFGYPPENLTAINTMARFGAELIEASTRMELELCGAKTQENNGVTLIDESNFGAFAAFHDAHEDGMFWTGERIGKKLDDWLILAVYEDGEIIGSLLASIWAEQLADVFAMFVDKAHFGKGIEERLLNELIARSCEAGKKRIMYFVEDDSENEKEAALKLGFTVISKHRGYKINL